MADKPGDKGESQPLPAEGLSVGYPIYSPSQPPPPDFGRAVDQATFFPAEESKPRFIGARTGHGPILMRCGVCGYQGPSSLRGAWGALHWLIGAMTLGISLVTPFFKDTAHDCPHCGRQVAVAKIM